MQLLLHRRNADAHSPLVRIQSLDCSKRFHRLGQPAKTLSSEVRAGDVLKERAEVDTRVLLGVAVGC